MLMEHSLPHETCLNTDAAELTAFFNHKYLDGECFADSDLYGSSALDQIKTYEYNAPDGPVQVWQHAFDLRSFSQNPEDAVILYHYTNELGFRNVCDVEQLAAQLFASLEDSRAHFGKGVYATCREPAVWGTRLRILMNSYSNDSPLCFDPSDPEPRRVACEWGDTNPLGHRAAYCIPLVVPRDIAYNIFERQTPDMVNRGVTAPDGKDRPIHLGEDYKGRPVHRHRDVWVIRFTDNLGEAKHAATASETFENILKLRISRLRSRLGDGDRETLACIAELARKLQGRGQLEDAERYYNEALHGFRALGSDGDELFVLINLGLVLKMQGRHRFEHAEAIYRETLRRCQSLLGEDHMNTLSCMSNLAALLLDSERVEEAELLHDKCLTRRREALGDQHPHTLLSMFWLGAARKQRGNFHEAELLLRECWQIQLAKLGESHPDTLGTMSSLGFLLRDQGKLEEAQLLCRHCFEKFRATLGELHPKTLDIMKTLSKLLLDQGNFEEVELVLREAAEKCAVTFGHADHRTKRTIMQLHDCLIHHSISLRKFGEVERLCRALLGRTDLTSTELNDYKSNLALALHKQGKLSEAEPLSRECLEACRVQEGERNLSTIVRINNLAELLRAKGALKEAELLHREGLEKAYSLLGEWHHLTLRLSFNYAKCLHDQDKLEEAEPLHRTVMEYRRAHLTEHDLDTSDCMHELGRLQHARGYLEEAESLLRSALQQRQLKLGDQHHDTRSSAYCLAAVLRDQ